MAAKPRPKFKLKPGLRATNVEVLRDGRKMTVKVEPGKVYEGDEFVKWCPTILMPLPETVKVGLPKPPEEIGRRGRRRLRPPMDVKPVVATPTATLTKKSKTDEEAERGQFPKDIPEKAARAKRPRPEGTEAKRPAMTDKRKAEKERLTEILDTLNEQGKKELMAISVQEGCDIKKSLNKPEFYKKLRAALRKKLKAV